MKKLILKLAALLSIFSASFLVSCETDIDVTAEWKDITIVYGLISQNDTVHYLRINKAFLGDGNSIEYAKEEDSLSYFGNLDVTITELSENGATRTFHFDTVTVQKEPGVFADRQLVYRSAFEMPSDLTDNNSSNDKTYVYKLLIVNKLTNKEIKSETIIVKDFGISTPRTGQPTIDYLIDNPMQVKWKSAENARRYDVYIRFWFDEVFNTTDTVARYFDWNLGSIKSSTLNGGEELIIQYKPTAIYDIGNSLIPYSDPVKETSVTSRLTDKVEYTIVASGDEFSTYLDVNGPTSGIIQDRPEYTNIDNGLGLFSARFIKKSPIMVGTQTEEQFIARRPNLKFVDKLGNK